jgi:hypothetical protein
MHGNVGLAHLAPGARSVSGVENAAVVLLPEVFGIFRASRHEVRIVAPLGLGIRVVIHE